MSITISDEDIRRSGKTEAQMRREIAVAIYARGLLTRRMATEFAGATEWEFVELCRAGGVEIVQDEEDLKSDLESIKRAGF